VKTASISRGTLPLLQAARASVREDGALALARGPVVEVLQNGDEGLEQRWELASKPAGTGDFEVRVELVGLEYVGETAGGHHFMDRKTGLGARYGKATWVDAAGVKTAVATVREGPALVMRVPARVLERSAFPAVLDPIISPEIGADTPVPAPASGAEGAPTVAYGGGVYLVVWTIFNSDSDVLGTRVRASDGAVLDLRGLSLATGTNSQSNPAVESDGTHFLVLWGEIVSTNNSDVRGRMVQSATGQLGSTLTIASAASSQDSPALVFDGTNYFAVWSDFRNNDFDIYGTRVRRSDGVPLDPAGIPISTAPSFQSQPAVAFDGTQFLVAWHDLRGGADYDIYGARVSATGTVLDASGLPISTATGFQQSPSIAAAGGTFFVVWDDRRDAGNTDVYGARVRSSDGGVLDPTGLPLATGPVAQGGSTVVSDGSRFLALWGHSTSSTTSALYAARVQTDGVVLDPGGVSLLGSVTTSATAPAVSLNGGQLLLVWRNIQESSTDIYGVRVNASDLSLVGTPVLCSSQTNSERSPAIAGGANSYLVVWQDSRDRGGGTDIYGVRVRASDGVVLDPVALPISTATNSQAFPVVAFDGSHFLVAWADFRNNSTLGSDIYGARVRESDGVVLDPAGIPIYSGPRQQAGPRIAFGDGLYFVTWDDNRSSSTDVYGARVRASDGVVLDPTGIAVATATYSEQYASTAFAGGSFLVAWGDSRNGSSNTDIYAARVRASDGVVLDTPSLPLTTSTGRQNFPAVASDGSHFLTVWKDDRTTTSAIYGARVRASDGAVLDTGGGRVFYPDTHFKGSPLLTFDGSHYLLVWPYGVNFTNRVAGGRVSPDLTHLDGAGFTIAEWTASTVSATSPAVGSWGRGRFLMAHEPYDTAAAQFRIKLRLVSDPVNGSRCANGPDCTSGFCVGGVCCESACTGGTCGGGTCVYVSAQLTCPADVVAEATGASGAIVSYPPATASGTPPLTVTYSQASGTRFALGTTAVTANLVDGQGRTASCSFAVTVRDTTAPTLSCPADVTVDATSTTGATVTYPPATASDSVSNATVSYSKASGTHFDVGSTPVSVTATDAAGNSASCSFTVTVRLPPAPQVTCPGNVTAEATSASGAIVSYPPANATGSDPLTVTYSHASGAQFSLGATSVTATATDGFGRTASCSFSITVRDSIAPALSCPQDLVAEAMGPNGADVSYLPPTATDAITASPSVTVSHASGSTFPLGSTRVTATATDAAGNASTCSFTITVRDTTAPTLSCPGDLTVDATSTTGATVTYPPATASDSVSNVTVSYSKASGTHFDVGSTPVSVTAADAAGNSASCSFTVTVRLPSAPQITCPADVVTEATSASGASVGYPPANATGTEPLTLTYSHASGAQFALGATSVTATVTDGFGRTSSCSFSITVRDTTAPSLSCPQDLVAEATGPNGAAVSYLPPLVTDAVTSAPTVTVSHASGSTFPLGSTRVTATATDAAGNASTCAFTITVRDTSGPALSCPASVTAEATGAEGSIVTYPPATISDATSSPTIQYSQASGTRFRLGTTDVTVTATDGSGNSSSCTFTVTVRDTTPPALACGADLVAEATVRTGTSVDFALPTATDAVTAAPVLTASHESGSLFPLGTTRVTVTASDAAGNSTMCAFTVTVQDTTAPEVGCPGPLTAEAQDATGATVLFSVPAPRDTVTPSPTVTASHSPGSRFPLGTTQVILSASDEAGNTASCSFSVTVRDTIPPLLTCPTDVQEQGAPPLGMAVNYPPATASDAVSTPTLSYSQASGTVFPVGKTPVIVMATDDAGNSSTCIFQVRVAPMIVEPPEPPPAEGCGCGAGSSTPAGLSWGVLMLLAWGVARRRASASMLPTRATP
jgi:uncharacterized protein (TIGR03382 family)